MIRSLERLTNILFVISFFMLSNAVVADEHIANGQLRKSGPNYEAWDENAKAWVSPEVFWENYANQNGGLTWGKTAEYPPYEKVKEHDTIIIETAQGPCLMEFFHTRWRRANDVRRWDTSFNDVAGCPYVFD